MHRAFFFAILALAAAASVPAADDSTGPNLDVTGIKIGMRLNEALAAVKADDPQLNTKVAADKLEGISGEIHSFVSASLSGMTASYVTEDIHLLLTLTPGAEDVWGIQRTCGYLPAHRPAMEATVAALLKKYGPASVHQVITNGQIQYLTWVFDGQGQLLTEAKAKPLYQHFVNSMEANFYGSMYPNALQRGQYVPADCVGHVLIRAALNGTPIDSAGTAFSVVSMTVEMSDDRSYRQTFEATRGAVAQAAKARESKAIEDASKQGAPTL